MKDTYAKTSANKNLRQRIRDFKVHLKIWRREGASLRMISESCERCNRDNHTPKHLTCFSIKHFALGIVYITECTVQPFIDNQSDKLILDIMNLTICKLIPLHGLQCYLSFFKTLGEANAEIIK